MVEVGRGFAALHLISCRQDGELRLETEPREMSAHPRRRAAGHHCERVPECSGVLHELPDAALRVEAPDQLEMPSPPGLAAVPLRPALRVGLLLQHGEAALVVDVHAEFGVPVLKRQLEAEVGVLLGPGREGARLGVEDEAVEVEQERELSPTIRSAGDGPTDPGANRLTRTVRVVDIGVVS